jgi:hypothetical protein
MHSATKCFKNAISQRPDGTYDVRLNALPSYHTLKREARELLADSDRKAIDAIEIHHLAPWAMMDAYLNQAMGAGYPMYAKGRHPILDGQDWTPAMGITPMPAFPLYKSLHRTFDSGDPVHDVLRRFIDPDVFVNNASGRSAAELKAELREAFGEAYAELIRRYPDVPEADFQLMREATDAWLVSLP